MNLNKLLAALIIGLFSFQLVFTDIDVSSLPSTIDPSIEYSSHLGLVDANLQPKPSLTTWDDVFKRSLQ